MESMSAGHTNRQSGESTIHVLTHAYALTAVARLSDVCFMLGFFSLFDTERIALFSITMAAAALFMSVLDLGMFQTLIREFTQDNLSLRQAVIAAVRLRVPIILCGLLILVVWDWITQQSQETFAVLLLAGFVQVLISIEWFCQAWLKSHERQRLANTLASIDPVGRLAILFGIYAAHATTSLVPLFALILAMHLLIAAISATGVYRLCRCKGSQVSVDAPLAETMEKLRIASYTFGVIGVVTVVQNRLDWLLLSHYTTPSVVANYALANKLYEGLLLGLGVAMSVFYPRLCRQASSPRGLEGDLLTPGLIGAGVGLSLMGALYFPDALQSVWGGKFAEAELVVRLLMPLAGLSAVIMALYYQLIARGLEQYILRMSFLVTTLQVLLNLALIPRLQGAGAVLGMALLVVLNLAGYLFMAHRLAIVSGGTMTRLGCFIGIMWSLAYALYFAHVHPIAGIMALSVAAWQAGYWILMDQGQRNEIRRRYEEWSLRQSAVVSEV